MVPYTLDQEMEAPMTDFSHLTPIDTRVRQHRPVQMKFYVSEKAHELLARAAFDHRTSMSAMIDTMILQEFGQPAPSKARRTKFG